MVPVDPHLLAEKCTCDSSSTTSCFQKMLLLYWCDNGGVFGRLRRRRVLRIGYSRRKVKKVVKSVDVEEARVI